MKKENKPTGKRPVIKVLNGNGRFIIPSKLWDAERLVIRQAYSTKIVQGRSVQMFFKKKPCMPDNIVEINGEEYELET